MFAVHSTATFCLIGALTGLAGVACSHHKVTRSGPVPCGNNQYASATVTLPDTGINAGHELQVAFIQHDAGGEELSELVIQRAWRPVPSSDPEPNPRVRLLDMSGRIFIDTLGTRFDQISGQASRPTWYAYRWIKDAKTRTALYEAFANQSLWLELWAANAATLGTRVRLATKEFGVIPPGLCM